MARKTIAAFLLLAVAGWAEVTLAPLLTMHLFHPSTSNLAALHEVEEHHHAAAGHAHGCCPHIRPVQAPIAALVAGTTPCEDAHRCCFRQAPSGAPTQTRPDEKQQPSLTAHQAREAFPFALKTYHAPPSADRTQPPPGQLSMVLRV